MSGISAFIRRGRDMKEIQKCSLSTCMHQGKAMFGHSENAPSASQEEGPHQNPTMLAPCPRTSSLQNCEKTKVCYFSHPFYDILLWQPEKTKTISSTGLVLKGVK